MSRVRQTLEGFEEVDFVEFISAKEQFAISYRSTTPMGEVLRKSVKEIIILPGVRKFLGGVGDKLNNFQDEGP